MSVHKPQVIIALDLPDPDAALKLVDMLGPAAQWFKIGVPLFTIAGPSVIHELHNRGKQVFLDFKLHDIPATVHRSVESIMHQGVAMLTVHASGGEEMMRQAVEAAMDRDPPPVVVGVTVLTSRAQHSALGQEVLELACASKRCGLSGVVCSPHEVAQVKQECGDTFITVVPGIRPANSALGDQRRTASPAWAVGQGADYLVVGRPVIWAKDPAAAFQSILGEVESALGS